MSRSVESCIRVVSNTQDMLYVLTGRLLEHEQDEQPVIMRDEGPLPCEGLTDEEWENHLLFEETIGCMLTAKVLVSSDSVFCTGPGAVDAKSALDIWKKNAEDVVTSNSCNNRNDIAGQSIHIEWRVSILSSNS